MNVQVQIYYIINELTTLATTFGATAKGHKVRMDK